tara:strand:- start:179 stop:637 length:459 start_codon:yes stop_codon:yes gene_type:complete
MIHVEATGGLKKDRELAEDVIWFCMDILMPRMRTLCIDLEFTKTLEDGAMGFTHMGDDDKDMIIQIDHRLSRIEGRDKLIETVAHEMVHVWQMATGRLKDKFRGGYKQLWKCKDGKYRNYNKTSYDRQPWETQAYALEGKLAELYEIMEEKG